MKQKKKYWNEVLKRIVEVVKFLATRGLAFRDADQNIGSLHNGNYLGLLELIGKFDSFLDEHLKKYGNPGKGNVSYLSANICEEFIRIMGNKLFYAIINEINTAKYFSFSVDSTPDICYQDQLALTIRYIKDGIVVERFLQYIPIFAHGAEYLTNVIVAGNRLTMLRKCQGNIADLQARIKQVNPTVFYIPCSSHSLNLVGVNAVKFVL